MKKKIILFLSVLLIAMFLTGCVSVSITTNPENSEDNVIVIDNPFANIIGKKELKEYDERKTEIAEDVENIIVDSIFQFQILQTLKYISMEKQNLIMTLILISSIKKMML